MGIKTYRPYTPSRRNMTGSDFSEITKKTPERSLLSTVKENAGRNNQGKITVRHQGGGNRQKYRIIDFKRNSKDSKGSCQRSDRAHVSDRTSGSFRSTGCAVSLPEIIGKRL